MRHRRPYDPLEVVVIDLEVETATLVAIHQASREALALRTECKTRHILDIGQTLDRRAGGEVVLETAHGRHRQLHSEWLLQENRTATIFREMQFRDRCRYRSRCVKSSYWDDHKPHMLATSRPWPFVPLLA